MTEEDLRLAVEFTVHSGISLLYSGGASPRYAIKSIVDEVMEIMKGESPLLTHIRDMDLTDIPPIWEQMGSRERAEN